MVAESNREVVIPRGRPELLLAFSDFTLELLAKILGVRTKENTLFPERHPIVVPSWLLETLNRRTQIALISEKARSEFIVVPILMACRKLSSYPLGIFSGQRLDVDPERGLVGECDFILAATAQVPPLRAPIATMVEAKKNDIETGLGHCVARMVAARIFNQAEGQNEPSVFGCVTTGEAWLLMQLLDDQAVIDSKRYDIDDVEAILGAILTLLRNEPDQKSN